MRSSPARCGSSSTTATTRSSRSPPRRSSRRSTSGARSPWTSTRTPPGHDVSAVDTVHRALCHRLFDALERGDVAGVGDCYAPDMTMWWNVSLQETSREENLAAITQGAGLHRRRTYDDRQIHTFDDGFVAQYTCRVV